ncbi:MULTISPECIES: bifunctional phosphoribosylaminoimidazolecarboxamide formyltransferase/IMP cyclohydrolase [Halanaerobium]|uniref:Bifunctional purine biosynthesis protein PurH n=1 Tax=Halanaerobium congolense TaxID=54121 RepID=A0A1G6JSJ7_9FIRM|nr:MULTISPECIES: bifunctional phosphoribosylaminoimidazolecarboxamide formyltransferase/IMP cyclohydrolase [Halanaerobium]PUU87919.1 MAG: phosphoribosylaminoimidazolecarboxamide formyltransferase / IMP cyclohydrolase [Halanaerobium sp.]PUU88867.1 MAG: phosphoribosylaminoimidazolecarboxamide formyltransferase / IMP cyclohydrolase [Halanaerobium sp.]SDC21673.1 IMP cyclohydrolase /phosphoribosylaminoimidazolecarboxamide formyltransferase [Halanaerobium congolense]SDK42548.1 IMP cyclohydrolase /pho
MSKIKRALISVSNKEGIVDFAKGLKEFGVEIISTGGTGRMLKENDVEVTDIEQVTNFPEMMDGRVKTLHPAVHGGILVVRDNEQHLKEIEAQDIEPIDLVVCNLYPFAETIAKEDVTLEEAVENIDIGGPTMIRSAAKNNNDVAVVVDPADYDELLAEMKAGNGGLTKTQKLKLAYKAFHHTAEYDQRIQKYLGEIVLADEKEEMPETLLDLYNKKEDLRYGENPHQKAAFYLEAEQNEPSISTAEQLHGKGMSYNNINDTDGALELIKEFEAKPAAAVIKHANPCGMATADSLKEAFINAHAGDPLSAFGSIVAANRKIDTAAAAEIADQDKFIEVVIAPDYEAEALEILKERSDKMRILKTGELSINREKPGYSMKKVTGGLLVQDRDLAQTAAEDLEVVTEKAPTKEQIEDLLFSWKVVKHVKSNAIVMAKDEMIVGVGAGQMSRVDSMIIAGRKAEGRQEGGVAASDAFFPFPDAVEKAAELGVKAIIQPGGSIRDDQVIEACNELGIAMVFTGKRHFRH